MNNAKEFSGIKFDGIQILRAISALMVALYHIDFIYNLKINTAIGVDIFFVISGFIIMYTTQSNLDNYAKKRIKDHIGRFTKLYNQIKENNIDLDFLKLVEKRDCIFPEIDYKIYY